jgi:hypothetical protein
MAKTNTEISTQLSIRDLNELRSYIRQEATTVYVASQGKARLAQPGYYIEYYGEPQLMPGDQKITLVHISEEGKCKYLSIPGDMDTWATLTWSAAPTKKQVAHSEADTTSEMGRYIYFPDLPSLLKYPNLGRYRNLLTQ